jgi:hypothetical protein
MDERPVDTKGRKTTGPSQKPAESPSRKRTRDEDEVDERPVDAKRRKTKASQPPISDTASRQSAQPQGPLNDNQPDHDSAPAQQLSPPTSRSRDSAAPVATQRQTRSAKAVTLLGLDGSGESTRQASRASRTRRDDDKKPLSKVGKNSARGAAASQSRSRGTQEKKSQRASARR